MSEQMGDCLLHADHHALSSDCYEAIAAFFALCLLERGDTFEKARWRYQLFYEETVLRSLRP